jgi:hypothetical protein
MAYAVRRDARERALVLLETAKEAADSKDPAVHRAHIWLTLCILSDALARWMDEVETETTFH